MATKSAEQKAIEKRVREEKRHALEAARRERAKAVVDAAQYIDSFRRLDNDGDISYLYDTAKERLHVPDVKHSVITREINKLRERYAQYLLARNVDPETMEEQVTQETTTVELRKDICILLVYAAADKNGQILVTNGITRTAPSFSTHGFEFTTGDSARESARWKAAVEQLERLGLIEAENYERSIFTVTDQGFKVADQAEEKWSIDTGKMPDECRHRLKWEGRPLFRGN